MNAMKKTVDQIRTLIDNDNGMTTLEYALGSLVAAAIAAVLYMVVNSDTVVAAFTDIIDDALSSRP